jgi:hypothetical protein
MPAHKTTQEELLDKLGLDSAAEAEQNAAHAKEAAREDIKEAFFDATQVQEMAKNSVDFLAGLALPGVFKYLFPSVYIAAWNWLLSYVHRERDFSQLALGLPRGFAKTTFIKIFLLYCILFTKRRFIIVFSENQQKANNIISDVIDMLSGVNVLKVFGDWKIGAENNRQDFKKFGFRGRDIVLMAGTVETARGINLKNERPDVMIFDDIQSRACADSQIQSETLEREMIGTAMKAKSPHGCLFVFVANMYPTKWSILRHLKKNPTWMKFIVGGILEDGSSLWEDLQPIQQLMKELDNDIAMGHPEIFFAEVLNDENASANNLIDLSKLPAYPFEAGDIAGGNFIIVDPASDKANSDSVSVGYFEVHNGFPVLMECTEDRLSPGETIRCALRYALTHNCRLIVVESNAYQYSLNYWFRFICAQMGIEGIEAVEIYSGSYSKNSRILATLKAYSAGEFFIHENCRAAVHLQITQWNPLKRDNVDGLLDLIGYCNRVLEMYGEYIVSMNVIAAQDFEAVKVPEFNSAF